jgi:hypothetical protein
VSAKDKELVSLTIRVRKDEHKALSQWAEDREITITDVVRRCIMAAIKYGEPLRK